MCLMSLIFYLVSLYCCFFHCFFSSASLIVGAPLFFSLISAHYRICSQHLFNLAVIIKRAAVKVQLVFMLYGPLNQKHD